MTHTPPPVKGYRELTQDEVDLVNKVKEAEAVFAEVWRLAKGTEGVDQRMVAIARTEVETGTMWLSRAVFKPVSPFDQK